MLWLSATTLRARRSGALGASAAIALAVVLVSSCLILLESSLRSPLPVDRVAGAPIVVAAKTTVASPDGNVDAVLTEQPRIDAALVRRLRGLPGVRDAIADRTVVAEVVDAGGRAVIGPGGAPPVGHGWSSARMTPLSLVAGRPPRGAGDVVVERGLATRVGDRLAVGTAPGRRTFTVVGVAAPSRAHGGSTRPAVFFRDDVAARLSGDAGRADLIGVLTKRGADVDAVAREVRDSLGSRRLEVLTGSKRGRAESFDAGVSLEDVVAGLTVFGALAAFVAIFVVASTFALSVQQRHRELALFRAIGTTPRQVRRLVAGEALVISLLAAVPALPVGVGFAFLLRPLFAAVDVIPGDLDVVVGWMPLAAAVVAALVTTQVAAFASARRAARVRPADALREAAVERRPVGRLRGLAGLGALITGVALVVVWARRGAGAGDDAPAATFLLMVAAALLGPVLARPFVSLLGAPFAAFGRGPGMLAGANSRTNLRRVASVATPLVLTVSLTGTMVFGRTTMERQTTQQASRSIAADHVLVAGGSSPGLTPDVVSAARRLPGVARASGTYRTSAIVADGGNVESVPARIVDAGTLAGVVDLDVTAGAIAAVGGADVAVARSRAKQLGWRLGDRVPLRLGDGAPVAVRVVALYERPLGFGEIVLSRALADRHVDAALDDAVFVKSRDGATPPFRDLARSHPGLKVLTRSEYLSELRATTQEQSVAVYVLLGVVVAFSVLAAFNALTMAITARRRELALLRLVGATRRQVTRMMRAETLIVALFGVMLGSLVAAPGLVVFSRSLTGDAVPSVPLWMLAALVGGSVAVTVAAGILPTRLALQASPLEAVGARE